MQAQFGLGGLATSKLLQEFHLPSSPADLLQLILQYALQQKIGNTLPLNLNAGDAFPTVEDGQLPGGPFHGRPFSPTLANLRTALPPGDYVVPAMAYCTQYSVHRPGQGTAYKLAPVKGTEAEAITTLLWRGTLAGKIPQELQATNWAIQSGVTYSAMPKPYQALVDELIPEYRKGLRGNMLDIVQSTYAEVTGDPRKALQSYIRDKYNKTLPLMLLPKFSVPAPPLETVLAKMGPTGELVLDARKQSTIILTAYTSQQRGEQTLFEGQGLQWPAEPAGEGPWTVRVPRGAYMRFVVKGGNMHGDNVLEIRVLDHVTAAAPSGAASIELAPYHPTGQEPTQVAAPPVPVPATSVYGLLGVKTVGDAGAGTGLQSLTASGVIGYSVGGGGAQALIPVVGGRGADNNTPQVQIWMNGTDLSNSEQTVVIGQRLALSASVTGDAGVRVTSGRWAVPGLYEANAVQTAATAKLVDITPADRAAPAIRFFWIDQGANRPVSYVYTLSNGESGSVAVTFTVTGPQETHVEAYVANVSLVGPGASVRKTQWALGLGDQIKPGVSFTGDAVSPPPAMGRLSWVQFVTKDVESSTGMNARNEPCHLDGGYAYATIEPFVDSPQLYLPWHKMVDDTRRFSARTFLLWKADLPDAVWVLIGYLDWSYSAFAKRYGLVWNLESWDRTEHPELVPSTIQPQWSKGNAQPCL